MTSSIQAQEEVIEALDDKQIGKIVPIIQQIMEKTE
jgi:hypothetical protein